MYAITTLYYTAFTVYNTIPLIKYVAWYYLFSDLYKIKKYILYK